jgi:hypothetical protein
MNMDFHQIMSFFELAVAGILLPVEFLDSEFFQVLAAFVALNTLIYVAVAILTMLPRVYVADYFHHRNRRGETRSIYPDGSL